MISRTLRLLLCGGWLLASVFSLTWARDEAFVLPAPEPVDFASLLANHSEEPRLFSYLGRPTITVIDFPSLVTQGRMFNRLVTLIERMGAQQGHVLDNAEMANYIRSAGKTEATLAYGNDFLVSEMVVFFNLAELGNITLNPEEIALRQFLLDQRLMAVRTGFYQALVPAAVVLSLPQEKTAAPGQPSVTALARQTILAHEISHAVYYTDPSYVRFCHQFWNSVMSEKERAAFRKFLARGGYNPENEELMINESQAYLMHTPDPRAFNPAMVGLAEPVIAALRQKFRAGFPEMNYP